MIKRRIFLMETSVEEENRTMSVVNEDNIEQYAMGLLYLDAILKKENYEVLTKDYIAWKEENSLKDIEKNIIAFKPDFIGIGVMSFTRVSTYRTIELIKKINPKIKIILGGMHSSMMYEQLLKNFPVEAVCIGESEETIIELLDALISKKSFNNIKGIAYKNNNEIIVTEKRLLKRDLDSLPYPSYDIFMKPSIKKVQILSSRGCPNKCNFCCLDIISRRMWRGRDCKKVVDEIEYITKKFPWVETIQFLDDTFTLDNQRLINICKEIINRDLKLKFYGQARIKPISEEMIYWMEKAGFESIYFGIESGSEKILKSINKGIAKQDIIETFKILEKFKKIKVEKFIIVGFPGETEETIKETIRFCKYLQKMKKFTYHFAAPLWVYPGTDIYKDALAKNAINDDYWLTDKPCPYYTLEHSEKWLMKMSTKVTIADAMANGKIYFAKKIYEKLKTNPHHYLKRFLGITENKKI